MKLTFVGFGVLSIISLFAVYNNSVHAQVTPDSTLKTLVESSGNSYTIKDGTRVGNNLFHSFSQFSIPTNGSASFNNDIDIQNIFSRVTGGQISNIDGEIRAQYSANLFLLNPAGIIFGQNASLNIGGSFVATTANSIKFADGVEFSATNPSNTPLLKMSVPIGLQMGSNAQPIQVNGKANDGIVPTNNLGIIGSPTKTIALVGGDINLTGGVITAPVGRIEIGAVGSGTVNLISTPTGLQLDYAQVQDFRDIHFTQRSSLWNPNPVGNPFGGIQVVGRDIRLDQSQIASANTGSGQGSNITVNAERSLFLGGINANAQAPSAWIVNQVAQTATGNGGAVKIQAGQLTLKDGAAIETLSLGRGAAGKVEVGADTVAISGTVAVKSPLLPTGSSSSRIASQTYASGDGGDVNVVARQLHLQESGVITTVVFPSATGHGGDISVKVAEDMTAIAAHPISFTPSGINAYTSGTGNSGNIHVSIGKLQLSDGGDIFTSAIRLARIPGTGSGNAGDVTVVAQQSIDMVGVHPILPTVASGIGSFTTGSGHGGNVSVTTPNLTMQAGTVLSASSLPVFGIFGDAKQSNNLGNSGNVSVNVAERLIITGINQFTQAPTLIGSMTLGNGEAGNVTIQTNQLVIQNGASINTSTQATGNAGALIIQANDILIGGQNIFSSSIAASAPILNETARQFYGLPDAPTGNAGRLNITTNSLKVRDGAYINLTNSGTGNAGQLSIQAEQIFLENGRIRATTASGQGGDINLDVADFLLLRDGSTITTEAGGNGNGGNITINAPVIVGLENSDIVANAFQGKGGNIDITTQGIIGLEYRSQLTSENDITASSKFGVNGTVEINNVGVDPNSGLVELPANITDTSQQIATGCADTSGSSFVATGRGGIPQNPTQDIRSDRTWSDVRDISAFHTTKPAQAQISKSPETLVQATGVHRRLDGTIELVANKSSIPVPTQLTCKAISQ
ncbi:S-layer family protein [Nostoc sp. FACHB-190]|uniref:two-partner secretion domain-containing protein n=1 Tax=Nostoc sp. FACHB-190 TaxID=2692838 RepID=UPI001F551724|nr:S-layer family protein [Nostoc sp. FACHB-190]